VDEEAARLLTIARTADLQDRRRRPRLRLAYPLRLSRRGETSQIEAKTQDISCEGFFCITDRILFPLETLECELVIPCDEARRPLEHRMFLRCRAEVVRVVPQAYESAFGVACRIADYTIIGADWLGTIGEQISICP
jgi:hypothetical protein